MNKSSPSIYSVIKYNLPPYPIISFLAGLETCRTINGILTLYGNDIISGANYYYEKQFKVDVIKNTGFIFGMDFWINKMMGLRLMTYIGINNIKLKLPDADFELFNPRYGYKYRDVQLTIFYQL